jgi:hypothetical protein
MTRLAVIAHRGQPKLHRLSLSTHTRVGPCTVCFFTRDFQGKRERERKERERASEKKIKKKETKSERFLTRSLILLPLNNIKFTSSISSRSW